MRLKLLGQEMSGVMLCTCILSGGTQARPCSVHCDAEAGRLGDM